MITRLDEYLVHQTPEPLAHVATGDRNAYDRCFLGGHDAERGLMFGLALGAYPNRRVMDAAFAVVRDGVEHVVHASRLVPADRTQMRAGPIAIEVLEPLRRLRVTVAGGDHGLAAELEFAASTVPIEEPRFTRREGGRLVMDYTRMTQFGAWRGWIEAAGERLEVVSERVRGVRDRSWGVRPVGEVEGGAPGPPPQFFWLWAPLQFDGWCAHLAVNEDAGGRPWHASGCVVATIDRGGTDERAVRRADEVVHRVSWRPGTRRAGPGTVLALRVPGTDADAGTVDVVAIELEPLLDFQMWGLGYLNFEWGHGTWQGEEAAGHASWRLDERGPLDPRALHVQTLVRATTEDGETGTGVLEQLVIGPHAPSGFTDLLDPAPDAGERGAGGQPPP